MVDLDILPSTIIFLVGIAVGILAVLLFNKARNGSATIGKIKQEKDDYQAQVEAHFEETSIKFKNMAAQYQDLYQHLSVGATSLCRPENVAPELMDQTTSLRLKPNMDEHNIKAKPPSKQGRVTASKAASTSATKANTPRSNTSDQTLKEKSQKSVKSEK